MLMARYFLKVSSNVTCRNADVISNFVNLCLRTSFGNKPSIQGVGYLSRFEHLLVVNLQSPHNRIDWSVLTTTMKTAHSMHCTSWIIPWETNRLICLLTFLRKAKGTCRTLQNMGFVFDSTLNFVVKPFSVLDSSLKTSGYFAMMSSMAGLAFRDHNQFLSRSIGAAPGTNSNGKLYCQLS